MSKGHSERKGTPLIAKEKRLQTWIRVLLDHLVSSQQGCSRNSKPERLGGRELNRKLEQGWLLDRRVPSASHHAEFEQCALRDDARVWDFLALQPNLSIDAYVGRRFKWKEVADRARLCDALAQAGLPA
jgi:hypothetical protein